MKIDLPLNLVIYLIRDQKAKRRSLRKAIDSYDIPDPNWVKELTATEELITHIECAIYGDTDSD